MSLVSPVKVCEVAGGVPVSFSSVTLADGQPVTVLSFNCTVYPVMALPPVPGSAQLTVNCSLPGAAATTGASGVVLGVPSTSSDHSPLPTAFLARTRAVYSSPLVRPVMV